MPQTMTDPGLFQIMYSCRSMRRLSSQPVPEELLVKLVEAGSKAPSAANAQNARFVVVRDRDVLARMARPWQRGIALMQEIAARAPARPGEDLESRRRTMSAVAYLAEHFEETPAVICVCVQRDAIGQGQARRPATLGSVIRHIGVWGAVQMGRRARRNAEQELWACDPTPTAHPIPLPRSGVRTRRHGVDRTSDRSSGCRCRTSSATRLSKRRIRRLINSRGVRKPAI